MLALSTLFVLPVGLGLDDEPLPPAPPDRFVLETIEGWRDAILPTAKELAFRDIPWRAALWPAVEEARAARKPVFLWAMNGHPLGCT